MTVEMFKPEGFHMHSIQFTDAAVSIEYTHQQDSTSDIAVTNTVHIASNVQDEQLQYWLAELGQAVEELVGHSQTHIKQQQSGLRSL